jgi:hypothetical protein
MKNPTTLSVLLLLSSIHTVFTFQIPVSKSAAAASRLSSAPPAIGETLPSTNEEKEAKLLSRDRYIATNRESHACTNENSIAED